MGIPETKTFDVLRLCPDWPAFTSGGPRHLHTTGAFLQQAYSTLHAHNPETWTAMTPEQMRKQFLINRPLKSAATVSTVPQPRPGLVALPDLVHDFFKSSFLSWTRGSLRAVAGDLYVSPRDLITEYTKLNADSAVRMLAQWERFPVELFKLV